jgi:putative phosphoesterase
MKLGILSDIHSNITALRTALERLTVHGVDHILCAGDLVDGGSDGDEVVTLIRANNILCVRGNHDQDAYREQAALRRRNFSAELHPHIFLSADTLAFVSSLPIRLDTVLGDKFICMGHGTPWDNRTYVWPESKDELFQRVVTEAQADIVILGHTHIPMCRMVGITLVVNAGSLDENRRETRQSYAVLDLTMSSVIIYDLATNKPIRTCNAD